MTPTLAHQQVRPSEGTPERWIWFLHGIFGAGRNWRSVARRLVEARPGWGAVLVDLRLHGGSQDFPPPHTLAACAGDLEGLARRLSLPDVVSGHSFGGKVALEYARRGPDGLRQVWVVDSTPSARRPGGDAVRMLRALEALPGPFGSRDEAVKALADRGFPREVGRWMATNLEAGEEGHRWRLDPEGLEALLEDFFRTDLWSVVEAPPGGTELHFVKAEDSAAMSSEDCRRVEAAADDRVRLHRLPGGHWLNVSNPDGLLRLLEGRLP